MSQKQIAERMEITQAAVSKYLSHPIRPIFGASAISKTVEDIAKGIVSGSMQQDEFVQRLCRTCMTLRIGSELCHRHRETVRSLGDLQCKVCNNLLGRQRGFAKRVNVLQDMENALEIIENTAGFVSLLPQVRASLVSCDKDCKSIDQVAGIPGRITDIKGKARAPVGPEFGASRHTAGILLWAKKRHPKTRACICIAGQENIVTAAKKSGFKVVRLDEPASEVEDITSHAESLLSDVSESKYGIQVPGGMGIEPVLYLFGPSATDLALACEKIASLVTDT